MCVSRCVSAVAAAGGGGGVWEDRDPNVRVSTARPGRGPVSLLAPWVEAGTPWPQSGN